MQTIEKPLPSVIVSPNQRKEGNRFTCICCRIKFDSADLQRAHFKTEWHLYNLKRRVCSLDPIDLENFEQIQSTNAAAAAAATARPEDETSNFDTSSYVNLCLVEDSEDGSKSDDSRTLDEDEWEKIGENDLLDEDYGDEEIEGLLAKMVKPDTCLFCDKKSSDLKNNIQHMNLNHGFFIPEEKYLTDLEGLMDYLGFKVGAGATCLWCSKQFASLHGVRLHMQYKDHCKIMYDQERAVSEFKDFYDYSEQEQIPMKAPTELDIYKKRTPQRRSNDWAGALVATSSSSSSSTTRLLTPAERSVLARQARAIKRFSSDRAQKLLKVSLMNNNTARARYRHQNPI